jgi:Na+-transporting NADH:ubiquinone oxidoreductase subunit NqrB
MQSTESIYQTREKTNLLKSIFNDARHIQIIYLSLFLIYGVSSLSWDITVEKIVVVVGSTLLTQLLWIGITGAKLSSLKSALITSLGLCLILQSGSLLTLGLAGFLAISAKFLLRVKGKHLFNPANFGIIASIVLFQDAWISPGQWGSDTLFLLCLTLMGCIVLHKIGRLETTVVFLGSLFLMEYLRTIVYQGWEMDVLWHKFSSGTLLLFAFFMITDPMTIPNSKKARMIWALILAGATFLLSTRMQIYTAPIWVIFFITPITVLLDKVLPGVKFEWNKSTN